LTELFGGSYLNVGQESRNYRIKPFSPEPAKDNLQLHPSFSRADRRSGPSLPARLQGGARALGDREEYLSGRAGAAPAVHLRRHHGQLEGTAAPLDARGPVWILFDDAEDTLTSSDFQTFNFGEWGDAPDVLEPLVFYVLHRAPFISCLTWNSIAGCVEERGTVKLTVPDVSLDSDY